jgi:ATP-dependent helicase HrpB
MPLIEIPDQPDLPIINVLAELRLVLAAHPCAVLQAPPGAGKTTGVPLALLNEDWLAGTSNAKGGTIIMLEPRRLAARASARRMAHILGENVGDTVGYRIRLDKQVSARTRIEVITEGILTRRLQQDPGLDGVSLVIFDEFHERSLDADLALALCLESQAALRPDLKILVMSATLDGNAVAALMQDAPIVTSAGRAYPVETRYADKNPSDHIEKDVVRAILHSLSKDTGNLLVFLPGAGEIRRIERLLALAHLPNDVLIAPLYGNLGPAEQDRAIAPPPAGKRKVVLATSIAETSLTIDGIRVVIDCGLSRQPRFDPRSGMTRLETLRLSVASADQRRGRAGRLAPGICYRLWTEAAQRALIPFSSPEIIDADLTGLALELAIWGVADPGQLQWLTPPPRAAIDQAKDLLYELGALDDKGRVTAHGKALAGLPLHPRLAHLVVRAAELGAVTEGARLAALLEEKSILKGGNGPKGEAQVDIHLQLQILDQVARGLRPAAGVDLGLCDRILKSADQICRLTGAIKTRPDKGFDLTGVLLAFAYPDRIAQARKGSHNEYLMANGRGASLRPGDPLAKHEFLALADLDGQATRARIFRAAVIEKAEIETYFAAIIKETTFVHWNSRDEAVLSAKQRKLGEIILKDSGHTASPDEIAAAVIEGIRTIGIEALPWNDDLRHLQRRVHLLASLMSERTWPDMSDKALLENLESWLAPYLTGITRRSQFGRIDLGAALRAMLDWNQSQDLERLAPTHITVPSGSRVAIDYAAGDVPVLAVRLQEMFGATETPSLASGRLPLLLHLLSPARRPVQVTRDLPSFWATTYAQVKADLKGRYPKHYWPDNPLEAEPTARAKRRTLK